MWMGRRRCVETTRVILVCQGGMASDGIMSVDRTTVVISLFFFLWFLVSPTPAKGDIISGYESEVTT